MRCWLDAHQIKDWEPMSASLQNKIVVVTGAASPIGGAVATRFAAEGASVVLADGDATAGAALASRLGMHFIATDLSCEEQVERAVRCAVERHGRIDCLVNLPAGVGAVGSIMDTSLQAWRATQAILLESVFFGIKHAARAMRAQRSGVILSLSGTAAVMGGLAPHACTAALHGVTGLTRSAASELSGHGIRVNAVAADTMAGALASEASPASPLGPALPDEIAAALVFLASDAAAHITAHTLVIDSGVTAGGFASGASVLRDRPSTFIGPSSEGHASK
jgi:NAD(P)-dependent dehydrogenase (short-subunit alcohol dehydrogenase family)